MFELDQRLANDCIELGQFKLSKVLLMNDARFPWVILVPTKSSIFEIFHLSEDDQRQLIAESSYVSQRMADAFKADSMNVAALGNVVPQLHVHHVVRMNEDACWPAPVWGNGAAERYSDEALDEMKSKLDMLFSDQWQAPEADTKELY